MSAAEERQLLIEVEGLRAKLAETVEKLNETEEKLRRTNEALDVCARTMAHNLRSPFSAMLLANEMLRDASRSGSIERLREEARESSEVIGRNVEKSYALVNELLKFAEAGEEPSEVQEVDISQLTSRILHEQQARITERAFAVEVDDGLGRIVAGETHMYLLFSDLITNALMQNDSEEPEVKISYKGRDADGKHSYEVWNNGSDLPEDASELFMPFHGGGASAETGIGLSTVRKVVELYSGVMRAFNRDGPCFAFTLKDWT